MSETAPILFTAGGEAFTSASSNGHLRVQLNAFAERVDYHQQNVLMSELTVRYAKISQMLDRRNRDLSESNATRQEAQRLAHLGNWSVNLITQTLVWSDTMYELLALDPSQMPSMLATRSLPSFAAISLQGTAIALMSQRISTPSISELLYNSVAPQGILGINLIRLGLFMATSTGGSLTSGLPMASSLTTTAQLASPPRISGP